MQRRVGLHHLCLRARSREDVDRCAALLKQIGAKIVRGPLEGTWSPGYYYVLFEDPDGIRLEVNFVPGAGLLAEGVQFNPGPGYGGRAEGQLAESMVLFWVLIASTETAQNRLGEVNRLL